jgi:hypothetical protein
MQKKNMKKESKNKQVIEKTLKDQIVEKMIDKLKGTQNFFSDEILSEFKLTDLSSKNDVKQVIAMDQQEKHNEDTQAGN